jgi:hypothetical protein
LPGHAATTKLTQAQLARALGTPQAWVSLNHLGIRLQTGVIRGDRPKAKLSRSRLTAALFVD